MSEPRYNPCPYCGDDGSDLNEIDELEQKLEKANERLKESEQVRTEYSFLIADLVRRADVKNDLYKNPTYQKANDQLNKFAIEQQIDGVSFFALCLRETGQFGLNDCNFIYEYSQECKEQLRKEQEK